MKKKRQLPDWVFKKWKRSLRAKKAAATRKANQVCSNCGGWEKVDKLPTQLLCYSSWHLKCAPVVELADTLGLEPSALGCGGSNPSRGTKF